MKCEMCDNPISHARAELTDGKHRWDGPVHKDCLDESRKDLQERIVAALTEIPGCSFRGRKIEGDLPVLEFTAHEDRAYDELFDVIMREDETV